MKKIFFTTLFLLAFLCVTLQCTKDYDERLTKLENKIATLNPVDEQLSRIKSSVAELAAVDKTINDNVVRVTGVSTNLKALVSKIQSDLANFPAATYGDRIAVIDEWLGALDGVTASLTNADLAIKGRIESLGKTLESYATLDWANATFATFKRQEELSELIASLRGGLPSTEETITELRDELNDWLHSEGILEYINKQDKALGENIDAIRDTLNSVKEGLETLLDEKIAESAKGIKEWVCTDDVLGAYCEMGDVDYMLDTMNTSLRKILSDQEQAHKELFTEYNDSLKALKTDLGLAQDAIETAYKAAIEQAIANKGIVGSIDDNKNNIAEVNAKIREVRVKADTLMSKLEALRIDVRAIAARIQSLEFVPDYQGGVAVVEYSGTSGSEAFDQLALKYLVSPASLIDSVTTDVAKLKAVSVEPLTRGTASATILIDLSSVEKVSESEGIVKVTADVPSDLKNLLLSTDKKVSICLVVDTGNTAISSGYTDLVAKEK